MLRTLRSGFGRTMRIYARLSRKDRLDMREQAEIRRQSIDFPMVSWIASYTAQEFKQYYSAMLIIQPVRKDRVINTTGNARRVSFALT